jgi:hypothetical protein
LSAFPLRLRQLNSSQPGREPSRILLTNPVERAAAVTKELAKQEQDSVGLREASIVRTGATPPATTVKSDLRPLLLDELDKRHEPYTLVAVAKGTSQQFRFRVPNLVPILGRAGHVCQVLTPCNSPRLPDSTPRRFENCPAQDSAARGTSPICTLMTDNMRPTGHGPTLMVVRTLSSITSSKDV